MTTGDKIRLLRIERKISQEELGNMIGVQKSAVHKYETGLIVNLKRSIIAKLADALNTTPAYLMGWEEAAPSFENIIPMPTMKKVPILGTIACGEPIYAEEQYGEYAEIDISVNCDFVLLAKGDSMIDAGIKEGYAVFIRKQSTVENGEIAAVILDNEATLKRVRFMPGGITLLEPCNPKHDPILISGNDETQNVQILGKAVAFQGYL